MAFGTYMIPDLQRVAGLSLVQYGIQRVYDQIAVLLDAHERLWRDKYDPLVDITTDTRRRYGGQDTMVMQDADEGGTPDVQKITAGSNVDFPLFRKQGGLGWTFDYLEDATVEEMMASVTSMMDADLKAADLMLRQAIFTPTNRTVVDRFDTQVSLAVKAFVNADGAPIPVDINGNTFNAATHTHYLATAALIAANIDSLITTVVEHYQMPGVRAMLLINSAQEPAIRALNAAGQFIAYPPPDLILGVNQNRPTGVLDPNNTFNRAIGTWGNSNAQIWVKPWIPAGYIFAYLQGGPKPLVMRIRNERTGRLRVIFEHTQHPLQSRSYQRDYGFGCWNRTNGAVLYTGGGAYVAPTTYP
jgi:hypothetical protein